MPDSSRRAVLAAGGLGAATLMAGAPQAAAAAAASIPRRARFMALRGTVVRLSGPAGRTKARVKEVGDLRGAPAGDARRYSVILRPRRPLPDGLYRVSSRKLGSTDLFLTNVDRGRAAALQAVVCTVPAKRLKSQPRGSRGVRPTTQTRQGA